MKSGVWECCDWFQVKKYVNRERVCSKIILIITILMERKPTKFASVKIKF